MMYPYDFFTVRLHKLFHHKNVNVEGDVRRKTRRERLLIRINIYNCIHLTINYYIPLNLGSSCVRSIGLIYVVNRLHRLLYHNDKQCVRNFSTKSLSKLWVCSIPLEAKYTWLITWRAHAFMFGVCSVQLYCGPEMKEGHLCILLPLWSLYKRRRNSSTRRQHDESYRRKVLIEFRHCITTRSDVSTQTNTTTQWTSSGTFKGNNNVWPLSWSRPRKQSRIPFRSSCDDSIGKTGSITHNLLLPSQNNDVK